MFRAIDVVIANVAAVEDRWQKTRQPRPRSQSTKRDFVAANPSGHGTKDRGSHTQLAIDLTGVPNRIRTGVAAVKGQCPRPLDDGDDEMSLRR